MIKRKRRKKMENNYDELFGAPSEVPDATPIEIAGPINDVVVVSNPEVIMPEIPYDQGDFNAYFNK